MDRPLPNTYWVLPGSLLAGEYPYGNALEDTQARLTGLLRAGIDTFIDLTHSGERPDYHTLLPPRVEYWRSPIYDSGVPSEAAHMRAIQARLRSALAVGRRVYLHCRAGIGRTGLVVGCYLVEQGLDGDEALARLNSLWQQSARSLSWPQVPQTAEQAEFIRDWARHRQHGRDAPAMAALRALRERFLGTVLGLSLGDALGCSTQFGRPGQFSPVADLLGGGPFELPRGSWSDDTAMALCVAESLLANEGLDGADLHRRWLRWSRDGENSATGQAFGITAGTVRALQHAPGAAATRPCEEAAPLARVPSVVLYFFGDRERAIAGAQAVARLTDASPLVQDCCRLYAAMLHAALRSEPLERVLRPPAGVIKGQRLLPAVAALARQEPAVPPPVHPDPALQTLASARWALHGVGQGGGQGGGGFRGGALRVVNLGGDADVAGALYGALAGAIVGASALPAAWTGALLQRASLEAVADRLMTAALVGLADSGAAIG
jgi:ADP-ribosyl-[dinitrogen reductase] hydrolase